jgi:iron complex transport system ATP-binding protein
MDPVYHYPPAAVADIEQQPSLAFEGVTLVRGGRAVLEQISWRVAPGERWVVLGPNGSGKSSLLQLAGAYELPSRGRVDVLGARFGTVDLRELRKRIGYAGAPLARLLDGRVTALEAVVAARHAALRVFRQPLTEADWTLARDLLADAGIGHVAGQRIATLSEGERQRVQLARTLMHPAEVLLLDEPTAGLDVGGRERLLQRLGATAADADVQAVVFVTHHLEEIPAGFTHAVLLREGRILEQGPIEQVLTGAHLSECFGLPLQVERAGERWTAQAAPPQEEGSPAATRSS